MLNTLETFLTLSYFLDPIYLQSTLMDAGIYPWNLLLTAFVTFPSYRIPPLNYTYNIHTTRKFRFFKNLGGSDAVTKDNIQICFTYLSSFGNQKSSYLCFFKKSCYDLWVFNICFHEKKKTNPIIFYMCNPMGACTNHVDGFLDFFDPPLPPHRQT